MSLALDDDVRRVSRWLACRICQDAEDGYGEGQLAIVRAERRGRCACVEHAVRIAKSAMINRSVAGARDRKRCLKYARRMAERGGHDRADRLDAEVYMSRLTPRQREAVRLRLWEGLSEAECGARMGCKPNTATVYYRTAIGRLRKLYGEDV